MPQARAGVGRLAAKLVSGAVPEEKLVAQLLLPSHLAIWTRFSYYYRLVRYAGFSRIVATQKAMYWSL